MEGLEYASFTLISRDGKTQSISVTTDYELKNKNTQGPGVQYTLIEYDKSGKFVGKSTNFEKNLYGIYQGGNNPKLPKIGENVHAKYDDYSLAPIDETDEAAKQHDLDYDKNDLAGVSGILDDRSTGANVKYIKSASKIEDKYKRGEKDAVTGKPVTKEASEAAGFGKKWFKRAESLKGKDGNGNRKETTPIDRGPKY